MDGVSCASQLLAGEAHTADHRDLICSSSAPRRRRIPEDPCREVSLHSMAERIRSLALKQYNGESLSDLKARFGSRDLEGLEHVLVIW